MKYIINRFFFKKEELAELGKKMKSILETYC